MKRTRVCSVLDEPSGHRDPASTRGTLLGMTRVSSIDRKRERKSFCRLRGRTRLDGSRKSESRRPNGLRLNQTARAGPAVTLGQKARQPPELRGSQPPFTTGDAARRSIEGTVRARWDGVAFGWAVVVEPRSIQVVAPEPRIEIQDTVRFTMPYTRSLPWQGNQKSGLTSSMSRSSFPRSW